MNAPIISAAVAQRLNQKVQQEINPHLFLFCNYEPTTSYAISEDGCFFIAIQDLYKFGVDSNCILSAYRKFVPPNDLRRFNRLRDILDIINMLRAVIDHNQSVQNGKIEQEHLEAYNAWVESTLHKPTPETQQDFAILKQSLVAIAKEFVQLTEAFIDCVKSNPNVANVVKEWTDRTLYWYCNNTKTEIYKGQLMNAYIANAKAAGIEIRNIRTLGRKIGAWIEMALYYPYDKEIQELEGSISSAENMLNGSNAMFEALRPKMSPDELQKFEDGLRQSLAENKARCAEVMQERAELEIRIGGKHIDFFFRNLEEQLRSTIKKLNDSGQHYTLLPQDLIQEDIELFFGNVPSPEGDF